MVIWGYDFYKSKLISWVYINFLFFCDEVCLKKKNVSNPNILELLDWLALYEVHCHLYMVSDFDSRE